MSRELARIEIAGRRVVPPPVVITAIIDTGATFCAFKPESIRPARHRALRRGPTITTASVAREQRYTYFVDVSFGKAPDLRHQCKSKRSLKLCPGARP